MRYNKIRKMDIANGPGIRVSIFMQGCVFNCKNCFNPETHDFNLGQEFRHETIQTILDLCNKQHLLKFLRKRIQRKLFGFGQDIYLNQI